MKKIPQGIPLHRQLERECEMAFSSFFYKKERGEKRVSPKCQVLVRCLMLAINVLIVGCAGGSGSRKGNNPPPWEPVDPDPQYSMVEATEDYFGLDPNRELIYYIQTTYDEETDYSWGYLKFEPSSENLSYWMNDSLSLFRDLITNEDDSKTYEYIKKQDPYYYVMENEFENPNDIILSKGENGSLLSPVWGQCTTSNVSVDIPAYGGEGIKGTYHGCFLFEERGPIDNVESSLTVKVWFAPQIGIVKKEEIFSGAVVLTRTWYLYGWGVPKVAAAMNAQIAARGNRSNEAVDKYNELINKYCCRKIDE